MTHRAGHLDSSGAARMVDVGAKPATRRVAVAACRVRLRPETLRLIRRRAAAKGDVLAVARVAGIQAAKQTHQLIPLCHPLSATAVEVGFTEAGKGALDVTARVEAVDRTGVEMEALVAAAVAALTIYDMCKSLDRGMVIDRLRLLEKSGGRSGHFVRPERRRGRP